MRQFIRQTRPYQNLYNILKELLNEQIPQKFKQYEDIDWQRLASHTVMEKVSVEVRNLTAEEYDLIVTHRAAEMTDVRINELRSLFFFLAKIQADSDLVEELKGGV